MWWNWTRIRHDKKTIAKRSRFTCSQVELSEAIKAQRKLTPRKRKDSNVISGCSGSDVDVEEMESPPRTKRKKQKVISTGTAKSQAAQERLYCVCKTPYDDTKWVKPATIRLQDLFDVDWFDFHGFGTKSKIDKCKNSEV